MRRPKGEACSTLVRSAQPSTLVMRINRSTSVRLALSPRRTSSSAHAAVHRRFDQAMEYLPRIEVLLGYRSGGAAVDLVLSGNPFDTGEGFRRGIECDNS